MEAGLPEEDSEFSDEGKLLHAYDSNPELDRGGLPNTYHRDLLRIAEELDERIFEAAAKQFPLIIDKPDFTEGREKELWIKDGEGTPIVSGHCDRWRSIPSADLLIIVDKKFGFLSVTPAVANLQLRIYAMGGAQETGAKRVLVAITQPRLPFDERLSMALYSQADLRAAFDELTAILFAARVPDAPLIAGEEQCRYCKAKLVCEAYKAKFMSITRAPERTLDECNDQQLAEILTAIQFADHIKLKARDLARERVEMGRMPGWTVGKGSEVREVSDSKRAISLLVMRGILPRDKIDRTVEMSVTALQHVIREHTGCTHKEAREQVDKILSSVIYTTTKRGPLKRV